MVEGKAGPRGFEPRTEAVCLTGLPKPREFASSCFIQAELWPRVKTGVVIVVGNV